MTTSPLARFTTDFLGGAAWFVTRMTGLPVTSIARTPARHDTLSTTYELMTQESDSLSVTCPPGIVWQWTLEVSKCGQAPTAVGTRNVRCTPNIEQPPCCLPGYEVSPQDPFGGGCVKTRTGLDTRLKSPPCMATKAGLGMASIEYRQQLERHAKLLHVASPSTQPLGAAALLGASVGLLLIQTVYSPFARRAALL